MSRSDYIKCISAVNIRFRNISWCGRDLSFEFCFESIDHAAANGLNLGRLTVCSKCRKIINTLLSHEKFEDSKIKEIEDNLKFMAPEISA